MRRMSRAIPTDPTLQPEVEAAKAQFIAAVERAIRKSGLGRDFTSARLSSMMSTLWNQLKWAALREPAKPSRWRTNARR